MVFCLLFFECSYDNDADFDDNEEILVDIDDDLDDDIDDDDEDNDDDDVDDDDDDDDDDYNDIGGRRLNNVGVNSTVHKDQSDAQVFKKKTRLVFLIFFFC